MLVSSSSGVGDQETCSAAQLDAYYIAAFVQLSPILSPSPRETWEASGVGDRTLRGRTL